MAGHYLSGEELFQQMRPAEATLPERGGRKEYMPDGSWLQQKALEVFYKERHLALSEERVKKLGSLAVGEWLQDEGQVKLTKVAGKFMQYMGHNEDGVNMLHPEEALFLMELGQLEVWRGGLPLSIQQAYALMLTTGMPPEHYLVYSHLARMGFIINRFQGPSTLTKYERQIGLHHTWKQMKQERRKRRRMGGDRKLSDVQTGQTKKAKQEIPVYPSKIHNPTHDETIVLSENLETDKNTAMSKNTAVSKLASAADTSELNFGESERTEVTPMITESTMTGTTEAECSTSDTRDDNANNSDQISDTTETELEASLQTGDNCEAATFSESDDGMVTFGRYTIPHIRKRNVPSELKPNTLATHLGITFPDIYRGDMKVQNPSVLPPGVEPQQVPCSSNLQQTPGVISGSMQHGRHWIHAANWSEYKQQLMEMSEQQVLQASPVGHLWSQPITPLVKPTDAYSVESILKKLDIFKEEIPENSLEKTVCDVPIVFDVHLPDKHYRKTEEKIPNHRVCITSQENTCCDGLASLAHKWRVSSDGVPVHWAVVDNGELVFYSFTDVTLPTETC